MHKKLFGQTANVAIRQVLLLLVEMVCFGLMPESHCHSSLSRGWKKISVADALKKPLKTVI